jgi:hypothetical protein
MGTGTRRRRQRQERLRINHNELAKGPGQPFYPRVDELLERKQFDEFAEKECAGFHAEINGRPSVTPGIYFRLLLVGYFARNDWERGIAWRAAGPRRASLSCGAIMRRCVARSEPVPAWRVSWPGK